MSHIAMYLERQYTPDYEGMCEVEEGEEPDDEDEE